MNNSDFAPPSAKTISRVSLRDLLAIGFRRKRIAALCFFGVLLGAFLFAFVVPTQYLATTKFMVQRDRADAVVSSQATNMPSLTTPITASAQVTEEELNSEIGLLQNDGDVLRKVVLACGLNNKKSLSEYIFGPASPEKRIAKAVQRLGSSLKVEAEKKSDLIDVSYASSDPELAAHVLKALGEAYIQKHVEVHTPPGQVQFFSEETERYKKDLADSENQLKEFSNQENGVAPTVERDIFLQKMGDFHLALQQTRSLLSNAEERIHTLQKQAGITPERLTTEMRKEDDAQVLSGLKTTLMTLEIKRTELLTKYQPDYPLVVEVDKEIGDTKASIVAEESNPIKQETTDRNPTYAWVDAELAKAKADYAGLKAQEAAMQAMVTKYEQAARDLSQKGLIEQDLERNYKANEQSYLLYLQKREQARMTEALDTTRIVNVAIAETPVVPTLPVYPPLTVMLLGTLVATIATIAGVYIQEHLDPAFHSPTEVAEELDVPLLASVPHRFDRFQPASFGGNGNGNGLGHDVISESVIARSMADQSSGQ
jgi:uncharacterized protein involved in exopolysaccharide biosynthesis